MPQIRLSTDFEQDNGEQTNCNIHCKLNGIEFMKVNIDYELGVHEISYTVSPGILELTHQMIAQCIYAASCYIDSILNDVEPPPDIDKNTGEWVIFHPTQEDPGPMPEAVYRAL